MALESMSPQTIAQNALTPVQRIHSGTGIGFLYPGTYIVRSLPAGGLPTLLQVRAWQIQAGGSPLVTPANIVIQSTLGQNVNLAFSLRKVIPISWAIAAPNQLVFDYYNADFGFGGPCVRVEGEVIFGGQQIILPFPAQWTVHFPGAVAPVGYQFFGSGTLTFAPLPAGATNSYAVCNLGG